MSGKTIDPAKKQEILDKIKNEGMTAYKASQVYGVNTKTIYTWIKQGVGGKERSLVLENNKLKKELDAAYRIIGKLTAEVSRPKG